MTRATRNRKPEGYAFEELPKATRPRRVQRAEGPQPRNHIQPAPEPAAKDLPNSHPSATKEDSGQDQRSLTATTSTRSHHSAAEDPRLSTNLVQGSDGRPLGDRFLQDLISLLARYLVCGQRFDKRAADIAKVNRKRNQRARRLRKHLLDLSPYRQDLLRGITLSEIVETHKPTEHVDEQLWTSYVRIKGLCKTLAEDQKAEKVCNDKLVGSIIETVTVMMDCYFLSKETVITWQQVQIDEPYTGLAYSDADSGDEDSLSATGNDSTTRILARDDYLAKRKALWAAQKAFASWQAKRTALQKPLSPNADNDLFKEGRQCTQRLIEAEDTYSRAASHAGALRAVPADDLSRH